MAKRPKMAAYKIASIFLALLCTARRLQSQWSYYGVDQTPTERLQPIPVIFPQVKSGPIGSPPLTVRDVPCGVPRAGSDDPFELIDANFSPTVDGQPMLDQTVSKVDNGTITTLRVVAAKEAQPGEICWQAQIFVDNVYTCGASILGAHSILTSGRCLIQNGTVIDVQRLRVIIGTPAPVVADASSTQQCPQTFAVVSVSVHPQLDVVNPKNDMAVLTLPQEIDFTPSCVCPICLRTMVPDMSEICVVSGNAAGHFPASNIARPFTTTYSDKLGTAGQQIRGGLKAAHVAVIGASRATGKCSMQAAEKGLVHLGSVICTENIPGEDPCQPEVGGPLVCLDAESRSHYQAGVVSYGFGCDGDRDGIATRIATFLDWIHTTTNGDAFIAST